MFNLHRSARFAMLTGMLLMMGMLAGCDDSSRNQGVGWHPSEPQGTMPPGFDGYPERWNKRVKLWLEGQINQKNEEIKKKRNMFFSTTDEELKRTIQKELNESTRALDILRTRQKEGDYIRILKEEDIPADLVWEDGMDNPEIGDPQAKKGGTIRLAAPGSFPDTFRSFGPNSNHGFRGRLYDEIEIGPVNLHPVTGQIIPGVAKRWAVAPDQRTVFYELFDDAAYSDGTKVRAIDFIVGMYIRTSSYSQDVYYTTVYQENASHITVYGEKTFSVTLPTPKPLTAYYASIFHASPPHFYSEFGPNFIEKYQWRYPPTTGAYVVDPDSMIRGRMVVMNRVKNWWAKDKKFYRYRNNVDHIVHNFIAEESKAIELFRIGELDAYILAKPELWHERMEIPEVHNGYIERATFFTIYPRPPIGIYLNTAKPPFNNRDVRIGFNHALNIQKVIDTTFRGDYQRLGSYASGYGKFTDTRIKAREFSPEKARKYFAMAGYTITGEDGILRKPDGTRLAVEVTFPNSNPLLTTVMGQLKEDARRCGLELQPDSLDATVSYRKVMEKRHQATFWSWGFPPPHPSLYQAFYSGYAYDEKGNVVPYTNNINNYSNPVMDKLVNDERDATNEEELAAISFAIQKLVHDEGIWVPGWTMDFARLGYWRWVRWPNAESTRFCFPLVYEPTESYLYWIDEEIKEETLEAKREGKVFPEVEAVYEQFRFSEAPEAPDKAGENLPAVPVIIPPLQLNPAEEQQQ